EQRGETVYAYQDGALIISEPIASFSASSAAKQVAFGYFDNGNGQNWTVQWDDVATRMESGINYWNLFREDGALAGASDVLTSALGLFLAGDTGKRVFLDAANNVNWGLWSAAFTAATQLTLSAIAHPGGARVYTSGGEHFVELTDPEFHARHVGKDVIISGSVLGIGPSFNNRTVTILEHIDHFTARVSNPGLDFVDEDELDWEFDTAFVTETSIPWELVDAASNAAAVLTLREALPTSPVNVEVAYTTVLSAQVVRNETIQNLLVAPDLYHPYYLLDIDEGVKFLINTVTAAGVIPRFGESPD
ncbi:MAG: hypothetical protein HKO76_07915, partial [Acidimicrobiia bacterium]|nr:hypothetical protein [Acidimicrobiia bacterium]